LPAHDCYPDQAKSVQTEEVREELRRFVRRAQDNVSMGQVSVLDLVHSINFNHFQVIRTDHATLHSHEYTQTSPLATQNGTSKSEKMVCRECKKIVMPDSVGILPTQKHGNKGVRFLLIFCGSAIMLLNFGCFKKFSFGEKNRFLMVKNDYSRNSRICESCKNFQYVRKIFGTWLLKSLKTDFSLMRVL
jgi:hypothetical protein